MIFTERESELKNAQQYHQYKKNYDQYISSQIFVTNIDTAECFRFIDTIILSLIQTIKCMRHSNQVNKLRLKLSGIAETFEVIFINCKNHFRKN